MLEDNGFQYGKIDKFQVLQHLRAQDFEQQHNYYRWVNETHWEDDVDRNFFSEEARFHLSECINS